MKKSFKSTIALLLCVFLFSGVLLTGCADQSDDPMNSDMAESETDYYFETNPDYKYGQDYDPGYDNGRAPGGNPSQSPDKDHYESDGGSYDTKEDEYEPIESEHESTIDPDTWYDTEYEESWDTLYPPYETDTDTWYDTGYEESWDTLYPPYETDTDYNDHVTTPDGLVLSIEPEISCWVIDYIGTGTTVNIPTYVNDTPVIGIKEYAFFNKNNITTVNIPETVECIEDYAFKNCTNLTTLNLPERIHDFSYYAFDGCYNLIQTENGISYVDKWIIDCNDDLHSVILRNDTVGIANYAFEDCDIESIDIPESVTCIGDGAFGFCQRLTSITIPENVEYLGFGTFMQSGIESATIYANISGINFLTFASCYNLTTVNIASDSIFAISEEAFTDCAIESITIPQNIEFIGAKAFTSCDKLTSVTFENPDGWKISTFDYEAPISITDASTTAEYLTVTYCDYCWVRF